MSSRTRRRFNSGEKAVLYLAASDGRCSLCGASLKEGWHADHVRPYALGGRTAPLNGQALCPPCNLSKGKDGPLTNFRLRPVQTEGERAMHNKWAARNQTGDNTMVALLHPASGKTTLALNGANSFFVNDYIDRVVVLVPRRNLAVQFEKDWKKIREHYDPPRMGVIAHRENVAPLVRGSESGYVTTYASLVSNPALHFAAAAERRTLLILDEAQQLGAAPEEGGSGTASGEVVKQLASLCEFVVVMSGTPYRSDGRELVVAQYTDPDENGVKKIKADVRASYLDGLANPESEGGPYLRYFEAHLWDGEAKEEFPISEREVTHVLSEGNGSRHKVLREEGYWAGMVDETVRSVREMQDIDVRYCGLIAAAGQPHARAIVAYLKRRHRDIKALLAVSDDNAEAQENLQAFRQGGYDILVTVNMAYIGFDHPPITVICALTPYRWEGYLRQLFARGLRVMKGQPPDEQTLRAIVSDDPEMSEFCEKMREEADAGVKERNRRERKKKKTTDDEDDDEFGVMVGGQLLERRVKGMDPLGDMLAEEAQLVEGWKSTYGLGAVNLSGLAALLRSKGIELRHRGSVAVKEDSDERTEAEKEKEVRDRLQQAVVSMDGRLMKCGLERAKWGFTAGRLKARFSTEPAEASLRELLERERFFEQELKPRLERMIEEYGS